MERTFPVVMLLLPAVVLLLQGGSCLRESRPPFVRWFGILAIALAGLDVVLALLLITGTLVPSREFAAVMVKGTVPYVGLLALLLGLPVITGLGWHIARAAAGQTSRLLWLMVAALLVGASAAYRIDALNPDYPPYARVYIHEMLWPPLVLWVGLCFFEACYAVLRLHARRWRLWADCALTAAAALWALQSSWSVATEITYAWRTSLSVALLLGTGLGAWLIFEMLAPRAAPRRRLGAIVAAAALGLWAGWSWPPTDFDVSGHWLNAAPTDLRALVRGLVWPIFPVVVGLLGLRSAWRLRRATSTEARIPLRPRRVLSFFSLILIAASFTELVYFGVIDPVIPLVLFVVGMMIQAEVTAGGPFTSAYALARSREFWTDESPFRRCVASAARGLGVLKDRAITAARSLLSMPSVPVAVAKAVVVVFALIVAIELPNAGQTVIDPFTTQLKEDTTLGQQVSDRVLNELALMEHRLRSDTVRLLPRGSEERPAFRLVPGAVAAGVDGAFAKSSEVNLGYVKVPAEFVLAVTRDPVRKLMGVRVLSGTVQANGRGHALLARSSTGETWRIELPQPDGPAVVDVAALAERLAFAIVSGTDREMRMAGLTHSWNAYREFRSGLEAWEEFETSQRVEDLAAAIRSFRDATRNHPGFALAFYRLGLALQRDGQPAAAAEALRTSLRINEDLVPAYLALASTLYDHDAHLGLLPAPAVAPASSEPRGGSARPEVVSLRAEARTLWLHVIRRPPYTVAHADRASAFYGLCRFAQYDGLDEPAGVADRESREQARRLAYYYCRRADHLYATLPAAERTSAPIKEAEASVLNDLARLLTRGLPTENTMATTWLCRRSKTMPTGPLLPAALRYLERAETLAPLNEAIRCRAATVALALGRPERMQALQFDASARVRLADRLARAAKAATEPGAKSDAYQKALEEYAEAIKLNPTLFTALDGFASTFWEWRLVQPGDRKAPRYARQAEEYARQAVEVARERRSKEDIVEATATLGHVLLAQARPLEAMDHLREANALAPEHARWNEVRWGLAQAYLCAHTNDAALKVSDALAVRREHALPLFDGIRAIERRREGGPFSHIHTALDPAFDYDVCLRNPDAIVDRLPADNGPLYVLPEGNIKHEKNRLCDRMGVRAEVTGHETDDLVLQVWGGAVSREIRANAPPHLSVQLHSPPRATHHYYFAQLQDAEGNAVSKVTPLQTFAEEGPCTKNLIRLTYVRER
jgi:tetratricopeptide (TPR) repeat protein